MSNGKIDKSKWYHKLHQLQKRLDRADTNTGHSEHKRDKRKGQLKRLIERVRGDKKMFSL
jgi:hypothetical protein